MSNGYANIWLSQTCNNKNWFRLSFKQKLKDQYLQQWNSLVNASSSGINYRIFKNCFGINPYFHFLNNTQIRILTAFRTRNHRLPLDVGRWGNKPINERICHLCKTDTGDEFHYLFNCNFFNEDRNKHIKSYYNKYPNTYKMNELMNSENALILKHLTMFTWIIMKPLKNLSN